MVTYTHPKQKSQTSKIELRGRGVTAHSPPQHHSINLRDLLSNGLAGLLNPTPKGIGEDLLIAPTLQSVIQ